MSDCAFCEIVATTDAAIVHETTETLSFLDHRPLFPGHVLVIPKAHVETLEDLPDGQAASFFGVVQLTSAAVRRALEAPGSFVATNTVVSQSVPHFHMHVVPRRPRDGLRGFFWPRNPYDDDAHLERVRAAIAAELN